jgi:hypothetical protein
MSENQIWCKDIHLLLDVMREKVKNNPLNMCFIFQNNNYENISKCIMGCYMFIRVKTKKQIDYLGR